MEAGSGTVTVTRAKEVEIVVEMAVTVSTMLTVTGSGGGGGGRGGCTGASGSSWNQMGTESVRMTRKGTDKKKLVASGGRRTRKAYRQEMWGSL